MKAIKIAIIMILGLNLLYSLYNWLNPGDSPVSTYNAPDQQVIEQSVISEDVLDKEAADGLDLAAVTGLVKEVRSGQELERRLNEKGGINNMDLNGDSVVDYLYVNEFGDQEKNIGYSITAEPVKGEVQEIGEVTVEKNGDRAEIQVIGNEQIYGPDAIYNDWTKIEREVPANQQESGGYRMYSSYFLPHPLWISPWYFGYYPRFFSPFPVMSRSTYITRVNQYNPSSVSRGRNSYQAKSANRITNPNRGKTATRGIARSLKNPTSTQKQFKSNLTKNIKSGGFGRTSRPAASSVSRTRSSSSSFGTSNRTSTSGFGTSQKRSSGSLFGKTGRSFGSSSGSFRSSSFGSRSFSFGK